MGVFGLALIVAGALLLVAGGALYLNGATDNAIATAGTNTSTAKVEASQQFTSWQWGGIGLVILGGICIGGGLLDNLPSFSQEPAV